MQVHTDDAPRQTAGYPIFLNLEGRRVVVIGGGSVAERKAATLLNAGAHVAVVSPQLTDQLANHAHSGAIEWIPRSYEEGDLSGACLAFCACGVPEVDAAVHAEALRVNCLLNVVDVPAECDFYVPSIVRRGKLGIAISTSGSACAVTKSIRKQLESEFDDSWEAYLDLMQELRSMVKARIPGDDCLRKPVFEAASRAGWRERLAQGEVISVEDAYAEALRASQGE